MSTTTLEFGSSPGVTEHPRLVFIDTQPSSVLKELEMPPYQEFFVSLTGVPTITTYNVADGDILPRLDGVDGIIGGGSGFSVYEEKENPWINDTTAFYAEAHERGIPQLLVCFSHHAGVKGLGGAVEQGKLGRSFGIETHTQTEDGLKHPILEGLPGSFELFSSHKDIVTAHPTALGAGVQELTRGRVYPNKSFAIDNTTVTIQDHIEFTEDLMLNLARHRQQDLVREKLIEPGERGFQGFTDHLLNHAGNARTHGKRIAKNWLQYYVAPFRNVRR